MLNNILRALHSVHYKLHLHLYTSFYILKTVRGTLYICTICCTFMDSHCKHPKFAWVALKIHMEKLTIIYQSLMKMIMRIVLSFENMFTWLLRINKVQLLGKSLEHPRLGWVGIKNKWSQLKLFIPKITKIKYILNASLLVRIQFLCLWFN